ncbi:MAG: haloacid dehalogenase-like hydrolase [Bacteroidales bacterium]
MKNRLSPIIIFCLFLLLPTSCGKCGCIVQDSLARLNWSERNYQVLNSLIKDYGCGGKFYNKDKRPYAVLDWDQTCAHFDTEEALMRYQMFNLRYKITKEQFAGILLDNINGITRLSDGYNSIPLADINSDLINDYNFLFDNFLGPHGTMTLSDARATLQYKDFIVKIPFLYDGYCATPGIGDQYGYVWVLYLLAGHTISEVKKIAKETISYELSNQLSKVTLLSPSGLPTKTGVLSYSYKSGLRIFPEMQNLISTFTKRGIEVFIVSASYKPVIEEFSGIGTYGYNVPADHVLAMELDLDAGGRIVPKYKPRWVKTVRQGKVDAIESIIKQGLKKNWDPLFSAVDSDGDYEMATKFPGMKLTLIWNRVKGGDIGKLCIKAVEQSGDPKPLYILQGRDENTGIVLPCSESIIFGRAQKQLLQ